MKHQQKNNSTIINSSSLPHNISKDMLLDLLRETRKSSKELLEIGKQFCEFIKSRSSCLNINK